MRLRLSYFTVEFIFVTDVYFLTVLVLTSSCLDGLNGSSNPDVTSHHLNHLYSNVNKSCLFTYLMDWGRTMHGRYVKWHTGVSGGVYLVGMQLLVHTSLTEGH